MENVFKLEWIIFLKEKKECFITDVQHVDHLRTCEYFIRLGVSKEVRLFKLFLSPLFNRKIG